LPYVIYFGASKAPNNPEIIGVLLAKKVLIVDDDPSILAMVEGILKSSGYTVRSTVDPEKGVRLTGEWKPDLILLDIMMPEMDGYIAARLIRGSSSAPIVFLSAKAEEEDILQGFEVGATDYIVKPFSAPEFLARIRAVLRRFETGKLVSRPSTLYQHGGLLIDFDSTRVRVDGSEVNISATEYKILKTLAQANGEIIAFEDLLKSVWGRDHRYDKSILYVSMSRLKQKIEKDPKNPVHIHTVKGVGYMMPSALSDQDEHLET
jgi:DNA-binding response OmpR family regulator